ncbi:PspC domain-containing protein [Quadrisphaera oryzae]|uniref:PspC domain-containing protein n=1 Tax=Quadrisphaera TaxID=317661 RepID=UPI001646BF79|nr:PspC domain-containing protein [Quadrisphaera sp. RL12-1S]MBC3763375.1 PspC domain-containing protein [Quadrisphaera sp. RL12-1S]
MTSTPSTAPGSGPGSGPGPGPSGSSSSSRTAFWGWLERLDLRRSDERWLGGVAAGTAERLGVDPVLLRVVVVVVALLGGVGLVLYAAAWLLLPDREGRIEARALVGGRVSASAVLALGLVALASAVPSPWSWVADGRVVSGGDVVSLVVVGVVLAVGVAMLPRLVPASAGGVRPDGQPVGAAVRSACGGPRRASRPAVPAWVTTAVLGAALLVGAAAWLAVRPQQLAPLGLDRQGWSAWSAPAGGQLDLTTPQVVSVAAAAATAVVALALVAAGLAGRRGDGLGFWAFAGATTALLALAVPPGADVRGVGDVDWRPLTVAQAERGYASWAGQATLDLRSLADDPAAAGATVDVELRHGVGEARVIVPTGADVEVRTSGVIGEVVTSGPGWTTRGADDGFFTSTTSRAPATTTDGTLEPVHLRVDARTAIGQLEIVRSAA